MERGRARHRLDGRRRRLRAPRPGGDPGARFVAAWWLRHEITASGPLLAVGFILMAVVFGAFIASLVRGNQIIELGILAVACVVSWLLAGWSAPSIAAATREGAPPPSE